VTSDNHGRSRISWDDAFTYYASLPRGRRSFGKVARKFGVSDTAVRNHAGRHGWRDRVAAIDAKTDERIAAKVVRSRSERVADVVNFADLYAQEVLSQLRAGDLPLSAAELVHVVKLAELLSGEATDRIQVHEVRVLVAATFELAGRFVPADRREEFLREVEAFTGELGIGSDGE
jgi:hypothetical protein